MRKFILFLVTFLFVMMPGLVQAEKAFIVRPGGMVQGASFGVKSGDFTWLGGLDFLWVSASANVSDEDWQENWETGSGLFRSHVGSDEFDGSAKLFIPHIGVRYALGEGSVRPYLQASLFKVFPFLSLSGSETDTYYNPDGSVVYHYHDELGGADLDESIDAVKDVLGAWGFTLGFGSEYYFADNFAVGGEFGLRYVKFSANLEQQDSDDWDGDGQDNYREIWSEEMSMTFGVTYAQLSLNYYF